MHEVESFKITCILLFILFCAVLALLNSRSHYSLRSHLYIHGGKLEDKDGSSNTYWYIKKHTDILTKYD